MESERKPDMSQEGEVVFKIVVNEKGEVRIEPGEGEKVVVKDIPLSEDPIEITSLNSLSVTVGRCRNGPLMACVGPGGRPI
jgi:hypothetical protein